MKTDPAGGVVSEGTVEVGQVWLSEHYGELRVIKVGRKKATLHGTTDAGWVTITAWLDRPWEPEMVRAVRTGCE